MKKSTFLVFTMPSFIMMTLFIALPLLIVLIQSFQFNQDVLETIEKELNIIAMYHDQLEMLNTYFATPKV